MPERVRSDLACVGDRSTPMRDVVGTGRDMHWMCSGTFGPATPDPTRRRRESSPSRCGKGVENPVPTGWSSGFRSLQACWRSWLVIVASAETPSLGSAIKVRIGA